MNMLQIEVNKLVLSPQNARQGGNAAPCEELKASIRSHGLMQNLVVTKGKRGIYQVIAGGRRLAALQALQREGHLPADYAAPCRLAEADEALELSLAENVVRQAMHPAEEFEAYAALSRRGLSSAAIAERFGVEESHVLKRLKLGLLAPELLAEYRAGNLTLESLMAFTLTDDREKQMQVFRALPDWQRNPREIRRWLTETMVKSDDKLAAFVGLDAYREAGGTTRADLFGQVDYLENPELLHTLAARKVDAIKAELLAEGWGWVEFHEERDWSFTSRCAHIRPQPVNAPAELLAQLAEATSEQERIAALFDSAESSDEEEELIAEEEAVSSRFEALQAELDAYAAFDPEAMRRAGCYVCIGHDGGLIVEKGLVKRADLRRLEAGREGGKAAIPEALRRDLEACRLQVAQAALVEHPAVACDLFAFTVIRGHFASAPDSGPEVRLALHIPRFEGAGATPAARRLEAVKASLPLDWLRAGAESEQFRAFRALPEAGKAALLAFAAAMSVRPQLATGHETTALEQALALTGAPVAACWRPGKAYLQRLTRHQLLAIGADVLGPHWAYQCGSHKKGELVQLLDRAFREPEQPGRGAAIVSALKEWLPPGMAFLPMPEADAA